MDSVIHSSRPPAMHCPFASRGLRIPAAEQALAQRLAGNLAFLRHRVVGLEHRESSDWDIAVRDPQEAGWAAEELFGAPLLRVPKRYVIQRYFGWGQLDFLPGFEWHGIPYLDPDEFWSRVELGDDGLPRPCVAHDAFIAWMTGLLWGGRYNRRYDALIVRAVTEDPGEFERCLRFAFGRRLGGDLMSLASKGAMAESVRLTGRLRRALWCAAMAREGPEVLRRQCDHWRVEAEHHLHPPFPWIAVLGPDGSGKSAVIEGLRQRLASTRLGLMESHWWPEPRKEGEAPGPPVTDPHAKKPRGIVLSVAKTAWLCLRWLLARWGRVGHARSKQAILLSDRYFDDLLVDPRRYRYGAPLSWARAMFRLLPRPDRVLVLLGNAETIHVRKQEVSLEELRRQLDAYERLASVLGPRAVVIDATQTLEEVREAAWNAVFLQGHSRRDSSEP